MRRPAKPRGTCGRASTPRRRIQQQRYAGTGLYANAALSAEQLNTHCALDDACGKLMKQAYQTLGLSPARYSSREKGGAHHRRPQRRGRISA